MLLWNKALWLAVRSPMTILTNQSALFQQNVATILQNLFMTLAPTLVFYIQTSWQLKNLNKRNFDLTTSDVRSWWCSRNEQAHILLFYLEFQLKMASSGVCPHTYVCTYLQQGTKNNFFAVNASTFLEDVSPAFVTIHFWGKIGVYLPK